MLPVHVLGLLHALILICLTWRSTGHLSAERLQRVSAAYLLIWCNLVYTGLLLSVVSRLNVVGLYFSVSVGLAAGLETLLQVRKVLPQTGAASEAAPQDRRFDRTIRYALGSVLALAALATAIICVHYVPNNWDSCSYRFGRVFFYLSQGNLLHFAKTFDLRLLYYPLNGVLAYVFFALYQFGEHWMYFVTGLAWIFAGLGIYSAARGLGASHTGSVVAAWLGLMSPNVLAQAASTTDEVLAATPILIGLSFGLAWLSTSRRRYAVLAGIGIGLGCGTKLHWTFYWVFILAAVILLAIRFLRKPDARPELRRRIPDALLAGCVALPMIVAFAVCNYISSGQVMDPRLAELNLNHPFRLDVAREKIRINTAQLFLNPIPDLVPPVHPDQRRAAYEAFNQFFMKCCFSDLVETIRLSKSGYRFAGIARLDGFTYTEYTVWLGFLPHLLLFACLAGVFTRKLPFASLAFLASFFFWHATDSVQNLYIDDAAAYYSFPAVIGVAGLASAWDLARTSRRWIGRLLLAAFFVVFATHAVLGANLLAFGGLRNVKFLWHKPSPPADLHALDPGVIQAIQSARQIYIPYTHWEILYWNFMRFNPAASYRTGVDLHTPPSGEAMMLLNDFRVPNFDLFPARLPNGPVHGLTYLGTADQHVRVFALNGITGPRDASGIGYTLVPFTSIQDGSASTLTGLRTGRHWSSDQSAECCLGLRPSDGIEIRYELESTTSQKQLVHGWFLPGQPDSGLSFEAGTDFDILAIETRSTQHPDEVVRTVHRLHGGDYVVGGNETTHTSNPPLPVKIPTLAPEPYEHEGKHYTVSWLGKETLFSVTNFGREAQGTLELQLATFGKPHTAELLSAGRLVGGPRPISHVFWENGAEIVRFNVTLAHGENKFVLTSKETPNELPGGRQVCFLLIGNVTAVCNLPGKP